METNVPLTRLIDATGPANPFRRGGTPSRPEDAERDVDATFDGLSNPAGGLPGPTMDGPPYTVKDGSVRLKRAVSDEWVRNRVTQALQGRVNTIPLSRYNAFRDRMLEGFERMARRPDSDWAYNLMQRYGEGLDAAQAPSLNPHNRLYKRASSVFHAVKILMKLGFHAHERMEERTPFHKSYVNQLQMAVDMLELPKGRYHLPLRAKDGTVAGFAQFKSVPNREHPVLATVLAPDMRPGGLSIEHMLKEGAHRSYRPEVVHPNKIEHAVAPVPPPPFPHLSAANPRDPADPPPIPRSLLPKPPGQPQGKYSFLETNDTPEAAGQFDTDHIDPRPPESSAWNRRHRHLHAPETGEYALRKAFDGVDTKPMHEVIEDGNAGGDIPEVW